jgi:hypothetical protein
MPPDELIRRKPGFVRILPWNIAPEVTTQHGYISDWGGKLVVSIPKIEVL